MKLLNNFALVKQMSTQLTLILNKINSSPADSHTLNFTMKFRVTVKLVRRIFSGLEDGCKSEIARLVVTEVQLAPHQGAYDH